MALIALETLKSSTGDDNLGLRIQINFDEIMQLMSEYITSLTNVDFFEFVADFIQRFHSHFTVNNLRVVLTALVLRITTENQKTNKKTLELKKKVKKTKKNKNVPIIVNKCWSVIRMFAENPFFCNDMIPVIE